MSKWSQDPCTRTNVSKIKKRKKDTCNPHYIPQISTLPLTKCPLLTPPLKMTTLISKTTLPFRHEWQRVECQVDTLPLWQSVIKPQLTNEHMREVINYSTHIHLLNTIKSILTQTLEKLCKKRVYGK